MAGDAKSGAGSLFGLAISPNGKGLIYVDDGLNTLRLLPLRRAVLRAVRPAHSP